MLKVLKRDQILSMSRILYLLPTLIGIFIAFLWHLGTSPLKLSQSEAKELSNSRVLSNIYNDPINAPHKLVDFLFQSIFGQGALVARLSSVVFAIFFAFCFYKLVVVWFGRSIGYLGAILFITVPFFIIAARQGTAEIMFFAPITLMAAYAWLMKSSHHRSIAWLSLLLSAAILLYTPGVIWWLIGSVIICRKQVLTVIKSLPNLTVIASFTLAGLLVVPAILASINNLSNLKSLLLLPGSLDAPLSVIKNIAWMILAIFIKAPKHEGLILGRLPLIDIMLIALLVFGVYALWNVARAKTYSLIAAISLAILLAGINKNYYVLALGLPAIGVFAAAGLRYLYIEWRSIFPRNPVAKAFALFIIGCFVLMHMLYGLRYSLLAWPNSVDTKNTYVVKLQE